MSYLTKIDNVPLYSTIEEALLWAKQYELEGYHAHRFRGRLGYMGGENHEQITAALEEGIKVFLTPEELALGNFIVTAEAARAYQRYRELNPKQNLTTPSAQAAQQVIPQQNIPQPLQQQEEEQIVVVTPQATPAPSMPSGGGGGGY